MTTDSNCSFDELRNFSSGIGNGNVGMLSRFQIQKRLSKRKKPEDISNIYLLINIAEEKNVVNLSSEDRELLQQIKSIKPLMEDFLAKLPVAAKTILDKPEPVLSHKISEVLDIMLLKGNNCMPEQKNKKNVLSKLLDKIGLTLEDDYSKFHNIETINEISRYVVNLDAKGDLKRKYIRYVKELAVCGNNINSDCYKTNVINNLPKIEKTKKSEKNPHIPYTKEQLLEMFNPKHKYFKEHPDAFFACLIAMFTGARANSAITLQYDDIIKKNGIWCINFVENHPIKHLKNEASERIVPIHQQLLDLGFVEYVQSRKRQMNAKGTDFIFSKCRTKNGKYNNKYTVREIFKYLLDIGVKKKSKDSYNFHSFRKNASIAMQDAGISQSYINDIIGWEGKTTMEQSYSNHTLAQIKRELEKFNYHFLSPHFAKWEKIMKNKVVYDV